MNHHSRTIICLIHSRYLVNGFSDRSGLRKVWAPEVHRIDPGSEGFGHQKCSESIQDQEGLCTRSAANRSWIRRVWAPEVQRFDPGSRGFVHQKCSEHLAWELMKVTFLEWFLRLPESNLTLHPWRRALNAHNAKRKSNLALKKAPPGYLKVTLPSKVTLRDLASLFPVPCSSTTAVGTVHEISLP